MREFKRHMGLSRTLQKKINKIIAVDEVRRVTPYNNYKLSLARGHRNMAGTN